MRETQHIAFYGPLGIKIFDDGMAFANQAPAWNFNPEVQAWRLGQRDTNPMSLADASWLELAHSDAGIINETSYNHTRFGVLPRLP